MVPTTLIDEAEKAKVMEIGTNKPIPEELIDEVSPNEEYSEAKSISTASQSATSTSSTSTRKPFFFDYNTLTYDDMSLFRTHSWCFLTLSCPNKDLKENREIDK